MGSEGNRGEGALLQRIRAHWEQTEGSDFARSMGWVPVVVGNGKGKRVRIQGCWSVDGLELFSGSAG